MSDRQRRTLSAIAVVLGASCLGLYFHLSSPRRMLESELGRDLPSTARDVRFHRSRDLVTSESYWVLGSFACDKPAFEDLVARLAMQRAPESDHLPTSWSPSEGAPSWWNATEDNPPSSAAKALPGGGWMVCKFELGRVYLKIRVSRPQQTEGPFR